jgi:glycosyltransferase involved in cell wall biosynthesis
MIRAGNIKCVTPPHKISFYQAVNTGIRLALGEYCIFFAAGDRIHPDCISKLSTALDIDKSAAAAFGKTAVSGSLTQVFQDNFTGQNQAGIIDRSEIQSDAMTDEYALGPNVLWRRSLNNTYGYFDWLMKSGADQDLWLKIARDFTFTHIPEVTGTALIDDISKDRFPRTMKQFSNIRQKYRLFPFSFGDGVSLSPEEKSLMKANRALEEIIGLIEKGKHKEAVSRYDSTKNLFESLPESRRIQRIIEQIRKKNQ